VDIETQLETKAGVPAKPFCTQEDVRRIIENCRQVLPGLPPA
jgi:hypothetical protein